MTLARRIGAAVAVLVLAPLLAACNFTGDAELTDRKILGEEGFITVVAVVNLHSAELVSGPDIHARGFADDDSVFDTIRPELTTALTRACPAPCSMTAVCSRVKVGELGVMPTM